MYEACAAVVWGQILGATLILALLAATFALPWLESGMNDTFGHFLFHNNLFVTCFTMLLIWLVLSLPNFRWKIRGVRLALVLLLSAGYWVPLGLTCMRLVDTPSLLHDAVAALITIMTISGIGLTCVIAALAWPQHIGPNIYYEQL